MSASLCDIECSMEENSLADDGDCGSPLAFTGGPTAEEDEEEEEEEMEEEKEEFRPKASALPFVEVGLLGLLLLLLLLLLLAVAFAGSLSHSCLCEYAS
jgi:hypothetical protein